MSICQAREFWQGVFKVNVVYAFGPSWIEYAAIAIYSLLRHNTQPIHLYLLTDRLTDKQRRNLLRSAKRSNVVVTVMEVEALYENLMPSGKNVDQQFTRYTLYRLLIPKLLREQDRALYLDTDTLVLRDLSELYQLNFSSNLIAAVPDLGTDNPKADLGLADTDLYINAGVLLLNLAALRTEGFDEEWVSLCQNRSFKYHDQDIINMTCKGKILFLDSRYNACETNTSYRGPNKEIRILHFISFKPWQQKRIPYAGIWRRYRRSYLFSKFWRMQPF